MASETSFVIEIDQTTDALEDSTIASVRQAAAATLRAEGAQTGSGLTILLADDATLLELNQQYRSENRPTDVLSFPAGPAPEGVGVLEGYLGDIAISVATAARQAAETGHSTIAEVQLLTVHGVLHLLGYDHLNETERSLMWTRQAAVLMSLGLDDIQPTERDHDAEN